MDIVNRIGIPPLNSIRKSVMGDESFSTSTCFVLKAGVYGDAHARPDPPAEDEGGDADSLDSTESLPSPTLEDKVHCPLCKKVLKNWHYLKHHVEHDHRGRRGVGLCCLPETHFGPPKHSCFHCRKKFTRKGNLTRHLKNVHFPPLGPNV